MKTTVDLPPTLLSQAKRYARKHRTTLREIIEMGIQAVISGKSHSFVYKLPDKSVSGSGLQAGVSLADWGKIRDKIYKGHGT